MSKLKKPSAKDLRIDQAQKLLSTLPPGGLVTYEAQAEVAMYLKGLKLTREDIGGIMGLSKRKVMTRLHKYKEYAIEGRIPSAELKDLGVHLIESDEASSGVILDEIEKMNRSVSTKVSNILLRGDILEQRLIAACASKLPHPDDVKAIDVLYKDAIKHRIKSRSKDEEAAVATNSDLHLGLDTPQHPFKKAIEANNNYVRRVIKLTDLQRQNFLVRHLYLNLLGDLIQGSSANYPAQRWDTTMPAVIQIERATEVLVKNIETYLVDFDEVTVNCSPGNHGNLAKDQTDPGNWETVLHRSLRWAFRGNPRVHFNIEEDDFFQVIDIKGSKFLLMHGHALKGGNFDGLVMSFRKYADILPPYRYAMIGHFHRFARLPLPRQHGRAEERTLYLSGTAVERDDFIEKTGGSPTPLWWLFFVGDKGITNEYAVRLYD